MDEQKAFLLFLASPYFNKKERLLKLATFLSDHKAGEPIDKRKLHRLLFGANQAFREQGIYDAFSQLGKLLYRFLSLQSFETDKTTQHMYLLKKLADYQQEHVYRKEWGKIETILDEHPYRDASYFEGAFLLYEQVSTFEAGMQRREQQDHLTATVSHLDLYYWIRRLKYSCELVNRSQILNQPLPLHLIEPIESWIKEMPQSHREELAVQTYWLIFQALRDPLSEEKSLQMISWLDTNSHHFSPKEASDMYGYAQNYCIRRINQGDSVYLNHLFGLFDQLVKKGLVLENDVMDHRKLKNMVTVGIRLKAYSWVDEFLHNYREKLLPAYRTDAYRFNLASLRYAQGRYSEALGLLQQVEFQDVFYLLSAKSLMLKIYYETDEDAALEFLLESLRLYLQRNRAINSFQRRVHLNLLRFTRKLYRLREQRGIIAEKLFEKRRDTLLQSIQDVEVANRSWLLEQVDQLTS